MSEICKRLALVMRDIGAVEKKRRSGGGLNYAFRGIDDVMAALQPVLIQHEVVVLPEVLEEHLLEYATSKGGSMQRTVLKVRYTFYAPDGSSVSCVTMGEGADVGDKSVNKAMAGAMKYAITQSLSIPTEETKDSENETPNLGSAKPSQPQRSGRIAPTTHEDNPIIKDGDTFSVEGWVHDMAEAEDMAELNKMARTGQSVQMSEEQKARGRRVYAERKRILGGG